MREKSRLFFLFFWLVAGAVQAQDSTFSLLPGERWLFKIAPLTIIDPEPSFMFGAEYVFAPRWSFQQELGYGYFALWQNQEGQRLPKSVIRARSEFRHYFAVKTNAPTGGYLALDLFYKRTGQPRTAEQDLGTFFQTVDFRQLKNVGGLHLKLGIQTTGQVVFDGFMGIGFRFVSVRTPGRPDGVNLNNFFRLMDANFSDTFLPSMAFGFRLGLSGQSLGRKNKRAKP
jgi:hypothetical protein